MKTDMKQLGVQFPQVGKRAIRQQPHPPVSDKKWEFAGRQLREPADLAALAVGLRPRLEGDKGRDGSEAFAAAMLSGRGWDDVPAFDAEAASRPSPAVQKVLELIEADAGWRGDEVRELFTWSLWSYGRATHPQVEWAIQTLDYIFPGGSNRLDDAQTIAVAAPRLEAAVRAFEEEVSSACGGHSSAVVAAILVRHFGSEYVLNGPFANDVVAIAKREAA